MYLATLHSLDAIYRYRAQHPEVPLTLYVDDASFQSTGPSLIIIDRIVSACLLWLDQTDQ